MSDYIMDIYPSEPPPIFEMLLNGKVISFEWHPFCGPASLTKTGNPRVHQSDAFLEAATLWNWQGRQMKDGLCVWDENENT